MLLSTALSNAAFWLLLAMPACIPADQVSPADEVYDAVGLLQAVVQTSSHHPMPSEGPVASFIQISHKVPEGSSLTELRDKYCKSHPALCVKPLNCFFDPPLKPDWTRWQTTIATPDGHANLKPLCFAPELEKSLIQECIVDRNLQKSAQIMYQKQVQESSTESTARYCFAEGHCANDAITHDITIKDAESFCDRRYGRAWTSLGYRQIGTSPSTQMMGMRACAMGIFHCDAVMCQEQYCENEKYNQMFANLSSSEPCSK